MTKIIKNQISNASQNEKFLFTVVVGMLVVVSLFYGYFVKQTIENVVLREKALVEARNINSAIGELESKYIAAKNGITIQIAYEKGFQDAEPTDYISMKSVAKSLSYNPSTY